MVTPQSTTPEDGHATAGHADGWKVERLPDRPLERTHAGRFRMPLRLYYDGEHVTDVDYVFSGDQAEDLLAEVSRILTGAPLDAGLIGEVDS